MPDVAQLTFTRSIFISVRFLIGIFAVMAGGVTALGFKFIDAVIDVPDESHFIFVNGVVVAAFIIWVLDLLPGAIFLFLPWRAEPGFGGVFVGHQEVHAIGSINSLKIDFGFKAAKAAVHINNDVFGISPEGFVANTVECGGGSYRICHKC